MQSLLGVVRIVAALAVIVVATVAALVVFEVLPREVLSNMATRVLLVAAIAIATAGIVTLLIRPQGNG
jgi:hypothetical protein